MIHAAGVIHPARVDDFEEVNARGTANVARAALAAGVRRLVHVSSNSPFGTNAHRLDTFRNDEPYHPYVGYGRSKMRAELAVRRRRRPTGSTPSSCGRRGSTARSSRPARRRSSGSCAPAGSRSSATAASAARWSTSTTSCRASSRAELTPTPAGRAWWIADAEPYEVDDIVATVGRALAAEGFDVAPNRVRVPADRRPPRRARRRTRPAHRAATSSRLHVLGEMDKTIACDISVARDELGYEPDVALEEGMRRSIRWCVEQGIEL